MKKVYITEEERVKCRKVMEAFSEMYEEQDVLVVDAGNYGFIKLQWFNEKQGFEAAIPYSDSKELFDSLWETWFDYHVFVPVLGTPIAELDYEDIFQTFPKDKQEELMKKKDYFIALCGEMQWE